jgi:uncharacterized membrane protein
MRKPTARRPTPPKRPPPEQQEVVHPSGKITHVETQWAGPLPPPAILDGFNHVAENGAERIFKQWETESEHRRMMERRDFTWSVAEGIFGKTLAFIFVLTALALAAYALHQGASWLAAFLAAGTIGAVVAAFIATNRPRPKGK